MTLRRQAAVLLGALLASCGEPDHPQGRTPAPPPIPSTDSASQLNSPLRLAEGSFAFVDSSGAQLLAFDALAAPSAVRTAVCGGALIREVAYVRTQPSGPADNNGQTAENFANVPGDVFRIVRGRVSDSGTCYLTADSGLVAAIAPITEESSTPCDTVWTRLASNAKHRAVESCWLLGTGKDRINIAAVQFATIDMSALASIVVRDGNHVRFQDFPAKYSGPGEDTWRVDDFGNFGNGLSILWVARVRGVLVLAMSWAGEYENWFLLAADSAGQFRTVSHTSRRTLP